MTAKQVLEMPAIDRKRVESHMFEEAKTSSTTTAVINKAFSLLTDWQLFELYESMRFDMNLDLEEDSRFPEAFYDEHRRQQEALV